MAAQLYVGNLSYATGDQGLKDLFAEAGIVTRAQVITDDKTHRSRGFGFVEMATDEGTSRAIATMHGRSVEDRALVVSESRPRENSRSALGYGGNDSEGGGFSSSGDKSLGGRSSNLGSSLH